MSVVVVGVGNRSRGDDAVGPEVAARVGRLRLPGVRVVECEEPLGLVELLAGYDEVVVVDATAPRGAPGRLHVVPGPAGRDAAGAWTGPRGSAVGSHGLGVVDAVELARAVDRLPGRLTLVGVEAAGFELGRPLSLSVRERLDDAVRAVVEVLTAGSG